MSRVVVAILLALGACKDIENVQPAQRGPGSGSDSADDMALPKPQFAVSYDGVPDEPDWKAAAKVMAYAWAESLNKLGVTTATVSPQKAPDGAIAKYLLRLTAMKAGAATFETVALVSNGRVINAGGLKRLEQHFAAIQFPAQKLTIGHVVQMLLLAKAVDAGWLVAPDSIRWAYETQQPPPTLVYDDKGALLTLYRDAGAARLEVRIDPGGLVTKTAAKKAGDSWQPISD